MARAAGQKNKRNVVGAPELPVEEQDEVELPNTIEDQVEAMEKLEREEQKERENAPVDRKVSDSSIPVVSMDSSVTEVLEWNKSGKKLVFDHKRFLKMPQSVLDALSEENRNAYYIALGMNAQLNVERASTLGGPKKIPDPFSRGRYKHMVERKLRKREGYHVTTKEPGEIDGAKMNGYTFVRAPTKEQIEEGYEPGEETGDILYVKSEDGTKVDAYVMEIPQRVYDQHLLAMSAQSQERLRLYPDQVQETLSHEIGTEVRIFSGQRPNDRDYLTEVSKKADGKSKDFYVSE